MTQLATGPLPPGRSMRALDPLAAEPARVHGRARFTRPGIAA